MKTVIKIAGQLFVCGIAVLLALLFLYVLDWLCARVPFPVFATIAVGVFVALAVFVICGEEQE